MKKYLYVRATVDIFALGSPGAISFEHIFVEADSEWLAYNMGANQFDKISDGCIANDYVIEVL